MNDKKGQVEMGLGVVVIVFITILVGVILFQAIAQESGKSTSTVSVVNQSLSAVVNGTAQYLTAYRSISNVQILNATHDIVIGAGNYTITNNALDTNGALSVEILPDATAGFQGAWRVSGTAQPVTYIAESGGRAVASLIAIFFALAVAVVALTPTLRSGVLNLMNK